MPFFSVIIPLYNKASFVRKTLDSVLNQNFEDYEVIIVNDGSTDNGLEIVESYDNIKITIVNQNNLGVSVARNNGISRASGQFIALLDADDYWHPSHLKVLKKATESWPSKVIFSTNYEFIFDNKKNRQPSFSIPIATEYTIITDFYKSSMKNCIVMTPSICIKKSVMIGGFLFDENIRSGQDVDLWIRLAKNYDFIFINKTTLKINRSVPNSLSKTKLIDDRLLAIEKNNEQQSENSSLRKYLDYNRFSIALQYKRIKEFRKSKDVIQNINQKNLTTKQQVLLRLPRFLIILLDKLNQFCKS